MSCGIYDILDNYKKFLKSKQIEYEIKTSKGDTIYDITLYFPHKLKDSTIEELNNEYIKLDVDEKLKYSKVGKKCDYLSFINTFTFNKLTSRKTIGSTPNKHTSPKTIGSTLNKTSRRKTIGSTPNKHTSPKTIGSTLNKTSRRKPSRRRTIGYTPNKLTRRKTSRLKTI